MASANAGNDWTAPESGRTQGFNAVTVLLVLAEQSSFDYL